MSGRTRRRCRAGLGVVTLAGLVGLGAPGPAGAANVARLAPAKAVKATDFAGYQIAVPNKHIRTATATFVIPAITCKRDFSGVGPSVVLASTVNRHTNTYSGDGAGIGVACVHKQPRYQSIIEVDSNFTNDLPLLSAGDHVDVNVKMGKHRVTVSLDDLTTGRSSPTRGRVRRVLLSTWAAEPF